MVCNALTSSPAVLSLLVRLFVSLCLDASCVRQKWEGGARRDHQPANAVVKADICNAEATTATQVRQHDSSSGHSQKTWYNSRETRGICEAIQGVEAGCIMIYD